MTDRVNPLVAFFRELARRRVLHAVVVYGGGGFLLLEATGNLSEALGLPHGLLTVVAVAVLLGFPVAMVLAWMYERTPDGIRRAPPSALGRGFGRAFAAALVGVTVVVGFGVSQMVDQGQPPRHPEPVDSAAILVGDPVVAVLPSAPSGSGDRAAEMTEALEAQLETVLSESHGLTLRWRGALRPLLDNGVPHDSIARRLDVDYFVRTQVTDPSSSPTVWVQLIDAATMRLLVSATVRSQAADPATLIETVTARIEQILRPHLGHDVRLRRWRAATDDTVALRLRWQAYLRQENVLASEQGSTLPLQDVERELREADSLLVLALQRDPEWRDLLLDRARLAVDRTVVLMALDSTTAAATAFDTGQASVERALELAPDDPAALALQGRLLWRRTRFLGGEPAAGARVDSAERYLRRAFDADPTNVEAAATLAELLFTQRGRWEEAHYYGKQAYRLDAYQRNWNQIIHTIALSAFEMGEDSTALRWCREGLARNDSPGHHACALRVLAWGRLPVDPDEAWRHYQAIVQHLEAPSGSLHPFFGMVMAGALARAELPDSARAVLDRVKAGLDPPRPEFALWLEAGVRFRLGEPEEALDLLRTLQERDPDEAALVTSMRIFRDYLQQGLHPLPG